MAYRTILVELASDAGIEPRLQLAQALARRFDAILVGVHVMPWPLIPPTWYGEPAIYAADLIEAQREANQKLKDRVQAAFRCICGTASDAIWREAEGDPGRLLAEAARTTDLAIVGRREAGGVAVPDLAEQLAMAAGVPVLLLPPDVPGAIGQTVLAGWNGSREATRALHDGLPFLSAAEGVILCAIGEDAGATLEPAAEMLRRHGIAAQPSRIDEPDGDAGEVLLAQAAAHEADLLVVGAYGHARLRELVFGGATRHVMREARLPVLLSS